MRSARRRAVLFGLLVAACSLAVVAAIVSGVRGAAQPVNAAAGARGALLAAQREKRPMVVFRTSDRAHPVRNGQVSVAAPGRAPGTRTPVPLSCDRVHFAGRTGLCLARGGGFAEGYRAQVFGADLRVRHELDVAGVPSRARVSPDGRHGSVTLFVTGHSYAAAGSFSTETTLIDLERGEKLANLEEFVVMRGGRRVTAVDVNFWGVTFAGDGDGLFATMATGGRTYLVQGSIAERRARVLRENVECPSLSPDGTRVAYKKRIDSRTRPWRLTVLDLATMRETPLAETRSVDDQAEWLDDEHVLYAIDEVIWAVRADGRGEPRRFMERADSPAVVRW